MTSQTSMSSVWHMSASSFTRPMFTLRKVFSSSFTISATRDVDTGTTRSTHCPYSAAACSVQRGVMPPTTFGMLRVVKVALPGSTRSGEKARKKSRPALRPLSSSFGWTSSSVVPGYVVLSRTISWPARSRGLI
jgi:hypothetical protein